MGRKCCVPNCKSNYKEYDASAFKLPKDETLLDKWLKFINRPNLKISENTVVCIRHFQPSDIIREDIFPILGGEPIAVPRKKPKLGSNSYPTIHVNDHIQNRRKIQNEGKVAKENIEKSVRNKRPSKKLRERVASRKGKSDLEGKKRSSKKKQVKPARRKKLQPKKKVLQRKRETTNEEIEDNSSDHVSEIIPDEQDNLSEIVPDEQDDLSEIIPDEQIECMPTDDIAADELMLQEEEYGTEDILEIDSHSVPFCRLCASPSLDAISIFENMELNCVLLEKIHTYLPIMVTADDSLPTTVCRKCIDRLEVCHSLVQDCLDADAVLKTIFSGEKPSQIEKGDKTVDERRSSNKDSSLDERILCEDYDFTNLTDVKFEVESNIGDLEERITNHIAGERNDDSTQNSITVTRGMRTREDSPGITQILNKESDLVKKLRKRKRKAKKTTIVKRKPVRKVNEETELEEIQESTLNGKTNQQNHLPRKRRKILREMPSVNKSSVHFRRGIPKRKDIRRIKEKIALDHTYTLKVP